MAWRHVRTKTGAIKLIMISTTSFALGMLNNIYYKVPGQAESYYKAMFFVRSFLTIHLGQIILFPILHWTELFRRYSTLRREYKVSGYASFMLSFGLLICAIDYFKINWEVIEYSINVKMHCFLASLLATTILGGMDWNTCQEYFENIPIHHIDGRPVRMENGDILEESDDEQQNAPPRPPPVFHVHADIPLLHPGVVPDENQNVAQDLNPPPPPEDDEPAEAPPNGPEPEEPAAAAGPAPLLDQPGPSHSEGEHDTTPPIAKMLETWASELSHIEFDSSQESSDSTHSSPVA